jgi:hypothetical protein
MSTSGVVALGQLYGFGRNAAAFAVEHVDTLKQADNLLANRCGEVLEAVIVGFGMGEKAGLALIGMGQTLLGNPMTGTAMVATGVSPIVLTCASIGAVHYGWNALTDSEREKLIGIVGAAFGLGVELIRAIIRFALDTIKLLLTRQNLAEIRKFVGSIAEMFGKRMSEITGALGDRVVEISRFTGNKASDGVALITSRWK